MTGNSDNMSQEHLIYHKENNIGFFTINREKQRNSLSIEAVSLFHKYLDEAKNDDEIRVVLITGSGEKAFCSGADLGGGLIDSSSAGKTDPFQNYAELMKKLSSFPKPTVAKINGYCLAGGMGIMLACDMVLAMESAKFGTPEVNVGLFPMMIGALIFRNVLQKQAMEMILTGKKISAAKAQEIGIITRSVKDETLDSEINDLLNILKSKSPVGLKIGKESFYAMADMKFEDSVDFLCKKLAEVISTEDAKEGITAFIEKRNPAFTGK